MAESSLKGKNLADDEAYVGLDTKRQSFSSIVKGNTIQCSVRMNISHCFMSKLEGKRLQSKELLYCVQQRKFQVRNSDDYIIELEGFIDVKKIECSVDVPDFSFN
ncbi:hypothetical protein V2J09_009288 [Rumex salicifolius]